MTQAIQRDPIDCLRVEPSRFEEPDDWGGYCNYVRVTDEWGVKAYPDEYYRRAAYCGQKIYAEFGLAPPVGRMFTLESWEVSHFTGEMERLISYCYSTRVADVFVTQDSSSDEWNEAATYWREARFEFHDMVISLGLPAPNDCHIGNYGLFEDQLVYIDFNLMRIDNMIDAAYDKVA